MPKINLPVPDNTISVTRPVALDITRQVLKATGLPTDIKIFYPGDLERDAQLGSTIGGDADLVKFPGSERITIEVEEVNDPERILATAVYRPEQRFVFQDKALDTYIKPVYATTNVSINVKYRAADKVRAMRWRDEIRGRVGMMQDVRLHEITYSYLLPLEFLVILKEIHRLRETVAPYGENYETYLSNHLTNRASLLTNLAGSQEAWGIAEKQMRIQGWFDFEGVPEEGSKEDELSNWTISFSYKFNYEKPIEAVMSYPLMIHNQPLSSNFRSTELPYDAEHQERSYSLSTLAFSAFEKPRVVEPYSQVWGVAIPAIDDFIPSEIVPSSMRIVTAMTSISAEDRRLLLNLADLGDYHYTPEILALLKDEVPYLTKFGESIFHVSLYRRNLLIKQDILSVDANLNVRANTDLSLRELYHVRLGMITDLSLLSRDAIWRLRNHGVAALQILSVMRPNTPLPELMSGDYLPAKALERFMSHMGSEVYQFNTVMTLFVQADHADAAV